MRKRILITGASGFVGRNVKEYLEQTEKYEIYAPTSSELNCLDEQAVVSCLKQYNFDYVLHFAVYGDAIDKTKDGSKTLEYNLRIYLNFARNAHLFGRMYYTGSGAEYDKRYPICSVTEEEIGKTLPTDAYGLLKYTVGQMIEQSEIYIISGCLASMENMRTTRQNLFLMCAVRQSRMSGYPCGRMCILIICGSRIFAE